MAVYKLSNSGLLTRREYTSFLAGNPAVQFTSYESIATVTVGSGGSSEVEFTSIPGTYKHLQIRFVGRTNTGSDSAVHVRFNSDSGSNYSRHRLYGENSTVGQDGSANNTELTLGKVTNATNIVGAAIIDILEYANTNIYKTARCLAGLDRSTSGGIVLLAGGNWRNTNAITSIMLRPDNFGSGGAWAQYSQFALYGIKGA